MRLKLEILVVNLIPQAGLQEKAQLSKPLGKQTEIILFSTRQILDL